MTENVQQTKSELTALAVTHIEIPTLATKKDQTAELFAEAFGWDINYNVMPNYGMSMNTQGKVSIGMPLIEENLQPVSNLYVHVDDINQTLELAKKHGCNVISEKNMISEDIGFGATFEDFSGNKIGLFSPE